MEEVKQKRSNDLIVISIAIVLLSIVTAVGIYEMNERKLMASNIESAIAKGIDPLAVRCSYARSDDITCVAHAVASGRKF